MSFMFRQQSVGETTYLIYEIDDDLEIDSFAVHMMANNHFTNIVQTQIVRINEKRQIQFNVTGLMKLNGRISLPRPKKEVLGIFSSILNAFEEVDAYMLDMEHLFLEWDYIYLDGQGNCMLMYLPFNHTFSKDKIAFLQEVVSRVQPDYQEKDPYLFDIQNAFSRGAIRKLSDFREIIKKSAGAGISNDVPKEEKRAEVIGQRREIEVKTQEKEEKVIPKEAERKPIKKSSASPKRPVMNIPGREPGAKEVLPLPVKEPKEVGKRGFFFISKKPKKESGQTGKGEVKDKTPEYVPPTPDHVKSRQDDMYESYERTLVIQEPSVIQGRDTGTVMLEQQDIPVRLSAKLVRKQDGAAYHIDRNKVVVGSGTAADIRINNNAVSRSHAVITCAGGEFCIEDNQSKNGSFINGRRIGPGTKEALYDGMTIRLANEDFVFYKG